MNVYILQCIIVINDVYCIHRVYMGWNDDSPRPVTSFDHGTISGIIIMIIQVVGKNPDSSTEGIVLQSHIAMGKSAEHPPFVDVYHTLLPSWKT